MLGVHQNFPPTDRPLDDFLDFFSFFLSFSCVAHVATVWTPTQRVHVLLYDILWPESASYMGALGPKYLIYGYLDPLGNSM